MKRFPPRFVAVTDGEDDFGFWVEGHEVLIDVAARGVEGGEIAAHVVCDAGLTGLGFFGR